MANRPKPTALKILYGNPGKRALNRAEPKPEVSAPTCPEYLDDIAKAEWALMVPHLLKLGLLTQLDRAALAAYCSTYSRWMQAEADIAKHGSTFTNKGMIRQRPEVLIAKEAKRDIRLLLIEFGMTPASRSRVSAAPDQPAAGLSAGARKRG